MRWTFLSSWALSLALVLGCESRVSLGGRCARVEECALSLVCVNARCGAECSVSDDCAAGARCLRDTETDVASCSLPADACDGARPCADGLRCIDGGCLNVCVLPGDCPDGRCVDGTCEPDLVRDDRDAGLEDAPTFDAATDAGPSTCERLPRGNDRIVDVALGDAGACAVTSAGEVWCWGYWPGLADEALDWIASTPFLVLAEDGTALRAIDVAVGSGFGCSRNGAAASDEVVCWGDVDGQGGVEVRARTIVRADRMDLTGASELGAGRQHACALVSGQAFCWGRSFESGALGDGTTDDSEQAVRASELGTGATSLVVGYRRSQVLVGSPSRLRGVGEDDHGELGAATPSTAPGYRTTGVDTITTGLASVIAPGDATCFLEAGAPRCWGAGPALGGNASGALDACGGTCTTSPIDIDVIGDVPLVGLAGDWDGGWAVGWSDDGRLLGWGANEGGALSSSETEVPRATLIEGYSGRTHRAAIGGFVACAIDDTSGELQCWGENRRGGLGRGTVTTSEPDAAPPCWAR